GPALGVNLVLKFSEKHRPPLIGLGAVLGESGLDRDEAPNPQQRHVLAVDAIERAVLAPRGQGWILPPVEQAQFERGHGLIVALPDGARRAPGRDVDPLPGPPHPYTGAIPARRDDGVRTKPRLPWPVLPRLNAMLRDDVLPCRAPNSHVLFLRHISRRWCRPRHIPRRAGLLRHVAQGLPVGGPLLPGRAGRHRYVGEHEPVGFGQAAVALDPKRGPSLRFSLGVDFSLCTPADFSHR